MPQTILPRLMRKSLIRAACFAAALFPATQGLAQSGFELGRTEDAISSPILTLDSDRLLNDSAAGQALDRDLAEKSAELATENRRIEAELGEEEKALKAQRGAITTEEFRNQAAAFDSKVNTIREKQDAKLRALRTATEEARRAILLAANPVLASIMRDTGAAVILEKADVLVALQTIDVTDLAIERLDEAMENGAVLPEVTIPDTQPSAGSDN